jgi:hypothetical protein
MLSEKRFAGPQRGFHHRRLAWDRERKREKNRGVVVSKEVDLQPGARKRAVEAFEKEQINQQSKEDGWRGDWARSVKLICP